MSIDACHCEPVPLEIVIANQRRNAGVAPSRDFLRSQSPGTSENYRTAHTGVAPSRDFPRLQSLGYSGHHRKNNVIASRWENGGCHCEPAPLEIVIANQRRNAGVAIPRYFRELPDSAHWCGPFRGFPPVTIPRLFRALPVTVSLRTSPQTGVAISRYFREPPKEQRL